MNILTFTLTFKAELNPKAATLDLYAYLVPCLVLDNIPKYKKSQSNHFLTTPTYIHTGGIADPWADWAMISNRPGNNKKGRQLTIACNGIKFSFPRFIWFCWAAIFFYFHQVLSVLWWLETLDTSGYVWALEKVSFELISPTYMFKGLSSALRASVTVVITATATSNIWFASIIQKKNSPTCIILWSWPWHGQSDLVSFLFTYQHVIENVDTF